MRTDAKRRLNPAPLRRNQFLISNSPYQFSEKLEKKNEANFHKPHIEIINEDIMLTNQYRRPAGTFLPFSQQSGEFIHLEVLHPDRITNVCLWTTAEPRARVMAI